MARANIVLLSLLIILNNDVIRPRFGILFSSFKRTFDIDMF